MGLDEELESMEDDLETDAEKAEEENDFDLEEEYEDSEYEENDEIDDEYDLGITREGVAEATDDFNTIYKEGVETAKELKEAFDEIKEAFNFGGLFKK